MKTPNKKREIKVINGQVEGQLSFNDVEFSEYYTREVKSANRNNTSGQIYLPQHLINKKVIILIEAIIIKLQEFEINIERETIRNTILELPITNWATTILSNSANFISKFL